MRLLTLTGAGGSGKTRIALQAGAELMDAYPDGVFSVSLATVTDPALVLPAIAEALGVNEGAGQSLAAYLAPRRLLLVIDNVEHVVSAAPDLGNLLAGAPGLRLLLTSREPMHLAGEQLMPIEPMAAEDAFSLFVARATAVLPKFMPHRRQPPDDPRDLRASGWSAAGDRAGCCSHQRALTRRDAGPAERPPQAADRRRARPACPASDVA